MSGKILGICVGLVALGAFVAIPAVSSAATLTDTEGGVTKTLAPGAKIIGQGVGVPIWKSALPNIECNENVITGSVHRNSGGIVELTIEDGWLQGNYFAGDPHTSCKQGGEKVIVRQNLTNAGSTVSRAVQGVAGTHWCIRSIEGDNWEANGRNCTGAGGEFVYSVTIGALTCGFKRTTGVPGTFNTSPTHASTARLTMTGEVEYVTDNRITGHSIFCPATLKWSNYVFDLYTDKQASTPTTGIHPYPVTTTNPLWFS